MRKRLPSANLVHQVEVLLNSRETASCISAHPRLKPVSSPLILVHFEKLAVQSSGLGGSQCATHLGPKTKIKWKERGGICNRAYHLSLVVVDGG